METIRIPLSSISARTFDFLKEANRLAKEKKSYGFTFSDCLFRCQLHIMTCNGIQRYFIRVSHNFDRNLITMVNMMIATKDVSFDIIDNEFVVSWE